MLLSDILRLNAQRFKNKTALVFGDERMTYGELMAQVNRLANALLSQGVRRGDRVAVLGRNSITYVVVYFALAKVGAVMVPVNFWFKGEEIKYVVEQSGSSLLIFHAQFADTVASLLPALATVRQSVIYGQSHFRSAAHRPTLGSLIADQPATEPRQRRGVASALPSGFCAPEDPHIILYTSGTTGFPKGATLTHQSHYLHALALALMTHGREEDVGLCIYPLFHTGGPDCIVLPHFLLGATVVIVDGGDPQVVLAEIERHRATNVFCVPTVWRRMLRALDERRYDVSSVRRCLGSSDTFPPALLEEILSKFPNADLYQTYGLTEAGCILTVCHLRREDRAKMASVGKAHPLVEVQVVGAEGNEVPLGEVGEVVARGPTIMRGYWNMPDKTTEALRDGWLHSGDLARMDEEGYLYIAGRAKDMIISGGENVYPAEVERVLKEHPKVRDCAVVGVPDREWGESVLAIIVPENVNLTKEEVVEFVRGRLAGFKKPRYVEFVDALPVTTATGKVLKAALRERYAGKYGGA